MDIKAQKCLFGKDELLARLRELRAAGQPMPANYNLACLIADNALQRQIDRSGTPYSHHTAIVSRTGTESETRMIIGKLHDVVEDSDWTIADLRMAGFSERILAALALLTHEDGDPYFDYIVAIGENEDARDVKLKDLRHNMSMDRFRVMPEARDFERVRKYVVAYNYLLSVKRGEIGPGTSMHGFLRLRPALDPGPALFAQHSSEPYPRPVKRPAGPQP